MIYSLLAETLPEGGKRIGLGEAAIDALIGFCFVFIGIALLVGIVYLVGVIMQKMNGVPLSKKDLKEISEQTQPPREESLSPAAKAETDAGDELSEETIAVITAAIAAYYEQNNRTCGFTVKRIKRI